ncbi:MAG: hypothetical protein AB7K71_26715, partial [Polyangiaceae bacterium]
MSGLGTKPSVAEWGRRALPEEGATSAQDETRAAWIQALTTQLRGAFYQLPKAEREVAEASRGWRSPVGQLSPRS